MITRRLALFRIAATTAVATAAAISAVQPKTPENPALGSVLKLVEMAWVK